MGRVMRTLFAAIALTAVACSPVPTAAPSVSSTAAPTAAASAGPLCDGARSDGLADTTGALPSIPGARRITFFFSTHTHGELVRPDRVTFAHYAGHVAALRRALPDPSASLFLGNGDDTTQRLCGVRTGGRHVVDAFNAGVLDANTYGFNEIADDIAPDELRALVAASRFTWLSANVLELDGSDVFAKAQGARRWLVKDVGGVRIGLTGLIVPSPAQGMIPYSYGRSFKVIDPVEAMREVVPLMRRDGAQLIVVLSHMDIETMERVARDADGVDAILGSHVWQPSAMKTVGRTILADGHDNMQQIGQLDVLVRDGAVAAHAFSVHAVRVVSPVHPEVAAALDRYLAAPKGTSGP
jgi:2',3'-cyclic-nucleotide 2'-phosphodiesterase (5'-nucleotidase family)